MLKPRAGPASLLPWRSGGEVRRLQFAAHRQAQGQRSDLLLCFMTVGSFLATLELLRLGQPAAAMWSLASLLLCGVLPGYLILRRPATYTAVRMPFLVFKRFFHVEEALRTRSVLGTPSGAFGRVLVLSAAAPVLTLILGAPLGWSTDLLSTAAGMALAARGNAAFCRAEAGGVLGPAGVARVAGYVGTFSHALLAATMPQLAPDGGRGGSASTGPPCEAVLLWFQLAAVLLAGGYSLARDLHLWAGFQAAQRRGHGRELGAGQWEEEGGAANQGAWVQPALVLLVVLYVAAAAWVGIEGVYA